MRSSKKPKLLPPKKRMLEDFSSPESMQPQASTSSTAPVPPENPLETSSVSQASQEAPSCLHSLSMAEIEKKEDQENECVLLESPLEGKPSIDSSFLIHEEDALKKSHEDVKNKGVYIPPYTLRHFKSEKIDRTSSIWEKGEISTWSARFCVICNDFKPAIETDENMECTHSFCLECIKDYVIEKVQEHGMPIKCPEKNCKNVLSEDILECVPEEQLELWEISAHDAKVLAYPQVSYCPFVDCGLTFLCDQKIYFIKACPKCWKLYCTKCMQACHMGMSCDQASMNSYYDPAEPYPFYFNWDLGESEWGDDYKADWGTDWGADYGADSGTDFEDNWGDDYRADSGKDWP